MVPRKRPDVERPRSLRCAGRTLPLDAPQVMGVLNVTPDSFSDGGRFFDGGAPSLDAVVAAARAMQAAGAAILDVGGESTRPGAEPVSGDEESARVIPVIEALTALDIMVSIDTRHGAVARAAIRAGVHMVNDVSAGADAGVLEAVRDSDVAYAIMHMQGTPQTMQDAPSYDDVVGEVGAYLRDRVAACVDFGIGADRLIVDPGFGFGKSLAHNLALLRALPELRVDRCPQLVGLSRKRMLGDLTGREVGDRLAASVAAAVMAAERGADIVRAHDVAATGDALKVVSAVNCQTG